MISERSADRPNFSSDSRSNYSDLSRLSNRKSPVLKAKLFKKGKQNRRKGFSVARNITTLSFRVELSVFGTSIG